MAKQKQQKQEEPSEVVGEPFPELHGVGIEKFRGKWLAVVVSTHGTVEVLNPLRNGQIEGESKALALSRAKERFNDRARRIR